MADNSRIGISRGLLTALSLVGFLLFCTSLLTSDAFAGSLTIIRSGLSYDSVSYGKISLDDYDFDNDNGGLRIGKGIDSAKVIYEILLPKSVHDPNHKINSVTVTVQGKCNYSPKIIIGGKTYELKGLNGTKKYVVTNIFPLPDTNDALASKLEIEFEVGSLAAYLDVKEISIDYEYSDVPDDTLKRFQEVYSADRTLKEYESGMVTSLWNTGNWSAKEYFYAVHESLRFADNLSDISGSMFNALKSTNSCIDNFQKLTVILKKAFDYDFFWINYDGHGPSKKEVSSQLTAGYKSLKQYAKDLLDLTFDGNISSSDVTTINSDINSAKSKIKSLRQTMWDVGQTSWKVYSNNGGEAPAKIMLYSLAPLLNVTYTKRGFHSEPSYLTGLIKEAVPYTTRPSLSPDLIITKLYPDPNPVNSTYYVGQSINWHVTVKNNGGGLADSSNIGYYLGKSATDYSNRIGTGSIRALNEGDSGSNYGPIAFHKGDVGQRFLICKADYNNTVKESSENNNARVYGPFKVELPKVATPVISPAGGTFTSSAQIKLSCSTSGATIRYTTDGTTPTSNSAKYTTALTVSRSSIITARAFENGYTESNAASANFTIITQVSGAVSVDVTPNTASWTIAGPSEFEGNGRLYTGNHTFMNAPLGSYAWAGQDITGYNTPLAETLSLAPGKTVAFNKIWTLPQAHDVLNVALKANGGTATAGSVGTYLGTSHPASYADDGNETTAWCNSWLMPDWLKIKFAHACLINEVGVVWGAGSHNQTYSISLSEDGKNWQVVVPSRASATDAGDNGGYHGTTTVSRERFPIVPTLARFIRIDVTNTSAPATHIFKAIVSELQAFSKKAVLTTGWKHLRYDLSGSACTLEHTTVATKKDLVPLFNITGVGPNVLTGDIDGDGIVDIVTTAGNELRIYRGNGTLKRSIPLTRKCFVTVLQDFDGDGVLDIGLGSSGPGFAAYIYKGDGTLLKTFKGKHAGGSDISISPLGMSKGKVLMSYNAGYAQTPRGFASFDYTTGVEDWYYQVGPGGGENSAADIDGNGLLDITGTSSTVNNGASGNGTTDGDMYLVVVDEKGHMKISQKYPSPSSGSVNHLFVDFKGSGSWGILGFEGHDPSYYPGRARIHLYSNSGSNEHIFDGPDNNSWSYAVGDIDGDGTKEVVASTVQADTTTYVLDSTLGKIREKKIPGQVKLLGDLTGDGNLDVVLLSDSGQLRVLDKNLNEIATAQVGNRNGMVIASDINGDGRVDLLCLTNKLYVLSFETSKLLGDVNGDGIVNLADATLAMRITAGFNDAAVNLNADVNGDGKIGIDEVIYILKNIAGMK